MKKIVTILICILLPLMSGCKKEKNKLVQSSIIEDSIVSRGYMIDTLPIGYWKSFDLQNNLIAISEFKIINNEVYLNQEITFGKDGDTLFDRSNFFTCTIDLIDNDSVLLKIEYEGLFDAVYDQGKSYPMLLYNNSINSDFSNMNKLKLDTLVFHDNKLYIRLPKNTGIRGVINELIFFEDDNMEVREVYFDYNEDYQDISEIR